MKSITIAGRVGRDAELRNTNSGDSVLSFPVAVDDRSGKEKSTLWFDVSIWGKRADSLSQYIKKGTQIAATGDLGMREHNDKTYLTIRANDVTLLGGGDRQERQPAPSQPKTADGYDLSDEIPF